eukprot:scaffold5132_cov115-Pinguiococcus_pyrenoidosus.AAC.1
MTFGDASSQCMHTRMTAEEVETSIADFTGLDLDRLAVVRTREILHVILEISYAGRLMGTIEVVEASAC